MILILVVFGVFVVIGAWLATAITRTPKKKADIHRCWRDL